MDLIRNSVKHAWPALLAGALALFFCSGLVRAQRLKDLPPAPPPPKLKAKPTPTPAPEEVEVLRVTSNLVIVPVAVTDTKGQSVTGLKLTDFRLAEEGRPQELAQIGDPEQVPLDIALLIDVSGSTNSRFDFEKEAAARFFKQVLRPDDRATIFMIDRVPVLSQVSATAEVATNKLRSIVPSADRGPTAFFDTVVEAAQYLEQKTPPHHRRVIVVISDGVDNYSEKIKQTMGQTREEQDAITPAQRQKVYNRATEEVLRDVQRADTVFYSINPSGQTMHLNVITKRGEEGMQRLADATGGNAFIPDNPDDLDPVFRQIIAELRAQYLLQYYSTSEQTKGQFLHITVSLPAHSDLHVRARQGYYPKSK
jgi:VWFA-related protein